MQYITQQFTNELFGKVTVLNINNQPWFIGNEIARLLGYGNPRDALLKHVSISDKGVAKLDTLGGPQDINIINESGLYTLIFGSKLPAAEDFKHWVTSEVLPTMRQLGYNNAFQILKQKLNDTMRENECLKDAFSNQSIDYHYNTAAKQKMIENINNATFLTEEQKQQLIEL